MQFFSYTPSVTAGPNGSAVYHRTDEDHPLDTLGDYGGRRVVAAADGASILEQPAEIDWRPEPDSPAMRAWFEGTRYYATLQNAKQAKQAARVQALEAAREAGFAFSGETVSSDAKSQVLILGTVQNASMALADGSQEALDAFAASLGNGWRAQSGAIVAQEASEIVAMGRAFAAHIAQCDATSQVAKAAIEAAETLSALNALNAVQVA